MSLNSKYSVAVTRIPDVFNKIRDGQAPDQFNHQLLKDWGFKSSNDRAFIPMLKELGFLSLEGKPTTRYHDYRDHSRSKVVMAEAIRDAYADIFLIKEYPSDADRKTIMGKFKSFHNVSDNVAALMMKNFYELLKLSDLKASPSKAKSEENEGNKESEKEKLGTENQSTRDTGVPPIHTSSLHYNIQIHLPATKDVEVYNALFKSLREHLIE